LRSDRAVCVLLGFPHPFIRIGVKITRLEILEKFEEEMEEVRKKLVIAAIEEMESREAKTLEKCQDTPEERKQWDELDKKVIAMAEAERQRNNELAAAHRHSKGIE
jgi:hypothetical protein